MMLSVLIIGTSILVFSTIGGYLMLQRLREASNIVDTTKAIFAADSGIECELYRYNKLDISARRGRPGDSDVVKCYAASGASILKFDDSQVGVSTTVLTTPSGQLISIQSIGSSIKSKRAFLFTTSTPSSQPRPDRPGPDRPDRQRP